MFTIFYTILYSVKGLCSTIPAGFIQTDCLFVLRTPKPNSGPNQ